MSTDTNHTRAPETEPALRGILALLLAKRQREDWSIDRPERILARAGLESEEIASLTGHDANQVRAIIEADSVAALTPQPQSVIDQARETITQNASRS